MHFGWRNCLNIASILLADIIIPLWVISFALFVSVGNILTQFIRLRIENWATLLLFATLLPLVCLAIRARGKFQRDEYGTVNVSWRVILPIVIPFLVLAPGLLAIVSSPTMQVMNHPDIHFGYIYQLTYNATPTENVFLAGYPANYYWLWHAYIAAIGKLTTFKASHVASVLNVVSILLSLLWIGQALTRLRLGKPRTVHLGLLIMFVYASVNMTGIISLITSVIDETFVLDDTSILLFDGASRYLHNSLTKIININTTNVGIAAFAAVFYICMRMLSGKIDLLSLVCISAWGIIGLACLPITTMYIVVVLLGGFVATGCFILLRQSEKVGYILACWLVLQRQISRRLILVWFFVSLILSLPLLKYISDAAYNLRDGFGFELLNPYNIGMINGALIFLLPLFLANFIVLKRRDDLLHLFVQLAGSIGLLLASSFVAHYDKIQHKGIYYLTILIAISALHVLQSMRNGASRLWRIAGKWILVAFLVLTFARIAYIEYYLIDRARRESFAGFDYYGNHIIHLDDSDNRYEAYYWIRDNAPTDAVIITPLDSFMFANVLLERRLYIKREQLYYTANISNYHLRVRQLDAFYRNDTGPEEYQYMSRNLARRFPDRPFFAVVKDSEVSPEVMKGRDADLVFEHPADGANVYRLHPKPDAPQEG